jgi:hypothetical protein
MWNYEELNTAKRNRKKEVLARSAAERYCIPKSSVEHILGVVNSCKRGTEIVFSENESEEFASVLLRLLKGLRGDVQRKPEYRFIRDTKRVGRVWWSGFSNRNKNVSISSREKLFAAGEQGLSREVVHKFIHYYGQF